LFTNSTTPHSIDPHRVVSIAAAVKQNTRHLGLQICPRQRQDHEEPRKLWHKVSHQNGWLPPASEYFVKKIFEVVSKRHTCNIDILNSIQDIVFTDFSFILCIQNMVHTTLLRLLSCWAQHTQHLPADSKRFNPKEKRIDDLTLRGSRNKQLKAFQIMSMKQYLE
jgi:hypothetical protein